MWDASLFDVRRNHFLSRLPSNRITFTVQIILQVKFFRRVFLSVIILFPALLIAQVTDSANGADSLFVRDSALVSGVHPAAKYDSALSQFYKGNRFLNIGNQAAVQMVYPKKDIAREYLFYLLAGTALVLGCLKFFYSRYFTTLFRVFFNSSLRQSQLTDQLLQAKLPSLFFNIFFVITGGFFVYLLLLHFGWISSAIAWWLSLPGCIAAMSVIYAGKYFVLKFTGWITSNKEPADTYIFIIFLINKIIGILLVPFIILMAFAHPQIVTVVMAVAFLIIAMLLIFRFLRSYGLLQGSLKLSRVHFFLYIIGIEILPILMIYKGLMLYLNKSL